VFTSYRTSTKMCFDVGNGNYERGLDLGNGQERKGVMTAAGTSVMLGGTGMEESC